MSDNVSSEVNLGNSSDELTVSGLPPTGDVDQDALMRIIKEMCQIQLADMNKKLQDQEKKFDREIKILRDAVGFKAQYVEMGGDLTFYSNLDELLPHLIQSCNGDEKALVRLKKWAESCRLGRKIKLGASFGTATLVGTGLGVGAAALFHYPLALTAVAAAAAGPAIGIIFGCIGGVLLIALAAYGGYHLYHSRNMGQQGNPVIDKEEIERLFREYNGVDVSVHLEPQTVDNAPLVQNQNAV